MRQRALTVALAVLLALACHGTPAAGQDQTLSVPPGFKVTVFAPDVPGVRYLTLGPGGVVYASRPGAGTIVRLPDANGDGVADSVVVVATGLNRPFGIAFRGDTMFVAENTEVVHFNPGSANKIVDVPNVPGGTGHWTRTIVFGTDGKMFVSVGSSCNLCVETDSMRAAAGTRWGSRSTPRRESSGPRTTTAITLGTTSHRSGSTSSRTASTTAGR